MLGSNRKRSSSAMRKLFKATFFPRERQSVWLLYPALSELLLFLRMKVIS